MRPCSAAELVILPVHIAVRSRHERYKTTNLRDATRVRICAEPELTASHVENTLRSASGMGTLHGGETAVRPAPWTYDAWRMAWARGPSDG